jgi:hypothetical protein
MEILYKPGKGNVVADALSRIRINLLCPLPTRSLRVQVIREYRNSPLGKLIKEVEKREEPTNRYTVKTDYSTIGRTNSDLGDYASQTFHIARP